MDACGECRRMLRIRETADARSRIPPPMTRDDLMWTVGLFEGEGSLSRSGTQWQLAVSMTDRDVVERLMRRVGGGSITVTPRGPGRLIIYSWRLTGRLAIMAVVEQLLPHAGNRRAARMREALADMSNPVTRCKLHRSTVAVS